MFKFKLNIKFNLKLKLKFKLKLKLKFKMDFTLQTMAGLGKIEEVLSGTEG